MPKVDLTNVAIELSGVEREALEGADDVTGADEPVVEGGGDPEATPPAASTPAGDEPSSSGPDAPAPASEPTAEPAAAAEPPVAAEPSPAAEPPAAAAAEEVIPKLRLPEIQPTRDVPADLDDQLTKLDADTAALDKRYYEDGEIESREYQKQSRLLNDRRNDLLSIRQEAALVQRTNEATRLAHWQTAQEAFYDQHPNFKNPVMHGALDAALRQLYADKKYAGADYGFLLNKAAESVNAAIGLAKPTASAATPTPAPRQTPAAAAAVARAEKAKADAKAVPQTLGGLPTAEANKAAGDEYSHLDNLSGMELELALSRMTPEQEQRYLQRMG